MSIMDLKLEFSDNQTISTTDTETQTASTNSIDLGAALLDVGSGTPLYLNIRVGTTFAGAATGGITFKLQEGTGAMLACSGSFLMERTMLTSLLVKKAIVMAHALPAGMTKRHLRMLYVNSSAATGFTAGNVDAWIGAAAPETKVGT